VTHATLDDRDRTMLTMDLSSLVKFLSRLDDFVVMKESVVMTLLSPSLAVAAVTCNCICVGSWAIRRYPLELELDVDPTIKGREDGAKAETSRMLPKHEMT